MKYALVLYFAQTFAIVPFPIYSLEECETAGRAHVEAGKSKWGSRDYECRLVSRMGN